MFLKTAVTMALAYAAVYPLQFWFPSEKEWIGAFRKFHIALPNVAGGIVLVAVWLMAMPIGIKFIVTGWKAALLSVSSYSWKKAKPNPWLMTMTSALGCYALIRVKNSFMGPGWGLICTGAIFGVIFSWLFVCYRIRARR